MNLPRHWQALVIQLLTVPGMLIAYYLLLYHNGVLFTTCGVNDFFDCGQVSGPGAPFSSIGPIPVALIGLIGYVTIFLSVWLSNWSETIDDYIPEIMFALTTLAFLFTLGLTLLEALVINAFCQFCLYSAGIVLVMFILALSLLISERRSS